MRCVIFSFLTCLKSSRNIKFVKITSAYNKSFGRQYTDFLRLLQASYCQKAGADSLLTLPELYFKPANVAELVSYVGEVAKAAPELPVLYYHIPSMSKVESKYIFKFLCRYF